MAKMDLNSDIGEAYISDAKKMILELQEALKKLEKDPEDKKALYDLIHSSHTLKGNSLQTGFFSVAYLAKLIKDIAFEIQEGRQKMTSETLNFLKDFGNSLMKVLNNEIKGEGEKLSKELIEKLDKVGETIQKKK